MYGLSLFFVVVLLIRIKFNCKLENFVYSFTLNYPILEGFLYTKLFIKELKLRRLMSSFSAIYFCELILVQLSTIKESFCAKKKSEWPDQCFKSSVWQFRYVGGNNVDIQAVAIQNSKQQNQ